MTQDLTNFLFASLVDNTLDLDAFSAAVSNIYEAACKSDSSSVAAVCDCLCGQGAKIIIRVLLDGGVERDVKTLIISCIRQCALIERLQMDLLRAGLVDALIYTLSEDSELTSDEHHRFLSCVLLNEISVLKYGLLARMYSGLLPASQIWYGTIFGIVYFVAGTRFQHQILTRSTDLITRRSTPIKQGN
jgi:hypothetical protein